MFDNVNSFGVVYDMTTRRTKAERRGTRWYIPIQILQAVSWFDKNDRLPRQARDKQMYQERPPLEQVGVCPQEESLLVGGVILLFLVRKTPFWSHFYRAKTIKIYQDRLGTNIPAGKAENKRRLFSAPALRCSLRTPGPSAGHCD
eukprot:COSAG06_NODE_1883_length_8145_cov_21.194009_6_plen_145_part_00